MDTPHSSYLTPRRLTHAENSIALGITTAKAGDYLHRISEMPAGSFCVIFARVSSPSQKDHLELQLSACKAAAERHGFICVGMFSVIGPANGPDARRVLKKAAAMAKQHGGFVLAESTSRFVRSAKFNPSTNRDAVPSIGEFEDLKRDVSGVLLVTVHDADLSPEVEHALETKRGMMPLDKRGGRPQRRHYKGKVERLKDVPKAIEYWKDYMSLGDIAKALSRKKSTIQSWAENDRTNFPKRTTSQNAATPTNTAPKAHPKARGSPPQKG